MFEKSVETGLSKSWIKLNPKKLERFEKKVDFYILVFYKTIYEKESTPHFEREYIVIPTEDLIKKSALHIKIEFMCRSSFLLIYNNLFRHQIPLSSP